MYFWWEVKHVRAQPYKCTWLGWSLFPAGTDSQAQLSDPRNLLLVGKLDWWHQLKLWVYLHNLVLRPVMELETLPENVVWGKLFSLLDLLSAGISWCILDPRRRWAGICLCSLCSLRAWCSEVVCPGLSSAHFWGKRASHKNYYSPLKMNAHHTSGICA